METPVHETAEQNVDVPTIVIREMGPEGKKKPEVCIQWNGQSDNNSVPEDAQFFFSSVREPDDMTWHGEPTSFHVIFIGSLRDWPNPNVIAGMAEEMGEDAAIAWVMSSHVLGMNTETRAPSFMFTVPKLGDPNCGIIAPVLYHSDETRVRLCEEIEAKLPLADKLLRDYHMELPPEEVPWEVTSEQCDTCFQLEHSHSERPGRPPNGDLDDLSCVCPACHRRWWQYNDHFHLWKHVTDPGEWDSIRRQTILMKAGYGAAPEWG